jgi:hypothetical protein
MPLVVLVSGIVGIATHRQTLISWHQENEDNTRIETPFLSKTLNIFDLRFVTPL